MACGGRGNSVQSRRMRPKKEDTYLANTYILSQFKVLGPVTSRAT